MSFYKHETDFGVFISRIENDNYRFVISIFASKCPDDISKFASVFINAKSYHAGIN